MVISSRLEVAPALSLILNEPVIFKNLYHIELVIKTIKSLGKCLLKGYPESICHKLSCKDLCFTPKQKCYYF